MSITCDRLREEETSGRRQMRDTLLTRMIKIPTNDKENKDNEDDKDKEDDKDDQKEQVDQVEHLAGTRCQPMVLLR